MQAYVDDTPLELIDQVEVACRTIRSSSTVTNPAAAALMSAAQSLDDRRPIHGHGGAVVPSGTDQLYPGSTAVAQMPMAKVDLTGAEGRWIDDEDTFKLAEAWGYGADDSGITYLDLSLNKITDQGAEVLLKAIKHRPAELHCLDLDKNELTAETAKFVVDLLTPVESSTAAPSRASNKEVRLVKSESESATPDVTPHPSPNFKDMTEQEKQSMAEADAAQRQADLALIEARAAIALADPAGVEIDHPEEEPAAGSARPNSGRRSSDRHPPRPDTSASSTVNYIVSRVNTGGLAAVPAGASCALQRLDLSTNWIRDEGVQILVDGLSGRGARIPLRILLLRNNELTDTGLETLCGWLSELTCPLTHCYVGGNHFTEERGMPAVAEMLTKNKSLRDFALNNSMKQLASYDLWVEALRRNDTILKIGTVVDGKKRKVPEIQELLARNLRRLRHVTDVLADQRKQHNAEIRALQRAYEQRLERLRQQVEVLEQQVAGFDASYVGALPTSPMPPTPGSHPNRFS